MGTPAKLEDFVVGLQMGFLRRTAGLHISDDEKIARTQIERFDVNERFDLERLVASAFRQVGVGLALVLDGDRQNIGQRQRR